MKQEVTLENVAKRQAKIVQEMGKKWMVQVFPDMTARPEWKQSEGSLRMRDVEYEKYENNTNTLRWGRALNQEKEAGDDNRARTTTRSFHLRQVTGKNKTLGTGTQRFAELVADEDQGAPVQDDRRLATSN